MSKSEDELKKENELLKSEIRYQQAKRDNEVEMAEWRAARQKDKQTEIIAFLAVGLFCAVIMILILTGHGG